MALSKKVRFNTFHRDGFRCAYCGRTPPTVTLEVDHIVPRAEGGTDDPENLTTSCFDCNRGKGAVPLDARPATLPNLAERTAAIKEREEQLREYNKVKAKEFARRDHDFQRAYEAWVKLSGRTNLYSSYVPYDATLRKYIELLGVEEVIDSMVVAHQRFPYANSTTVKYFVGILKNKAGERG